MEMEPAEPSAFPYQQLKLETVREWAHEWQIRILIVEPSANFNAPIICRLVTKCFGDNPEYEALSYTWGEPGDTTEITINDHKVIIRRNLYAAIQALRLPDATRRLWADAICINQEDLEEKSTLVLNMPIFYSRAQRTIVWLGPASEDSSLAMDIIRLIGERKESPKGEAELAVLKSIEVDMPSQDAARHWTALANLFGRSYWSRAWVVQEMAYSRHCIVKCGEKEIRFLLATLTSQILDPVVDWTRLINRELCSKLQGMHTIGLATAFLFTIMNGSEKIEDGRDETDPVPMRSLGYVLSLLRRFECSDPRDKVYGCLHLASLLPEGDRDVDYSEPCAKLFARVARIIIEQDSSLRLLSSCDTLKQDNRIGHGLHIPDLPTWAPNWAAERPSAPLPGDYLEPHGYGLKTFQSHIKDEMKPYRAAGETNAKFQFSDGSTNLIVQGTVLDVIANQVHPSDDKTLLDFQNEAGEVVLASPGVIMRHLPDPVLSFRITMAANRGIYGEELSVDDLAALKNPFHFLKRSGELISRSKSKVFFTTNLGYMGLGPLAMKVHDTVCLLKGCFVPMVLRRVKVVDGLEQTDIENISHEEASFYRVIGPAYVHGVMEGEEARRLEGDEVVEFVLR